MSDPAIEAAQRAFAEYWPDQGAFEFGYSNEGRFGIDAAREMAKPIRELHRVERGEYENEKYCTACGNRWPCDTAKLVFTTAELES